MISASSNMIQHKDISYWTEIDIHTDKGLAVPALCRLWINLVTKKDIKQISKEYRRDGSLKNAHIQGLIIYY